MKLWLIWAIVLIAQNFSFTFVSRARNSGSLSRHVRAAVLSNGIWFISQIIIFGEFMKYVSGKYGVTLMVLVGLYYTAFTIFGSVLAHWWALRHEYGAGAVGANKKYHQVTQEEWTRINGFLSGRTLVEESMLELCQSDSDES